MKWSEAYTVGVPKIDTQHKMLFQIVTDYGLALDEDTGEATYENFLQALRAYCTAHFAFEEGCMAQHNCPVADKNQTAHKEFLSKLAEYELSYQAVKFVREDAKKLVTFLEKWLTGHICGIDVGLRTSVLPTPGGDRPGTDA